MSDAADDAEFYAALYEEYYDLEQMSDKDLINECNSIVKKEKPYLELVENICRYDKKLSPKQRYVLINYLKRKSDDL